MEAFVVIRRFAFVSGVQTDIVLRVFSDKDAAESFKKRCFAETQASLGARLTTTDERGMLHEGPPFGSALGAMGITQIGHLVLEIKLSMGDIVAPEAPKIVIPRG